MRFVVWLVLLFGAAVVAAIALGGNDGVVSVYWGGWRLELSLNLFLLGLAAACLLLVFTMQAVSSLLTLPERAREWRALRHERAAQGALREALGEFLGGRFTRSLKAAQRVLAIDQARPGGDTDRELQVLAHLLSAANLHRLQDRRQRDEQMQRARAWRRPGAGSAADDGALLLDAQWAVEDQDPGRALAVLGELAPGVARRTQALRLRLRALQLAAQPLEALRTARLLAKHQGFSALAARGLLRSLACDALGDAHDAEQLQRTWSQLDAGERGDAIVVACAAGRAGALGASALGRDWLLPVWERMGGLADDERERVALAMTRCVDGIGSDWLRRLEAALAAHPGDAAVAAAAGMAFAQRRLWGPARLPLERAAGATALAPAARRRAWLTLAQLAREQGDAQAAADCLEAAARVE
jgi:HemY protein